LYYREYQYLLTSKYLRYFSGYTGLYVGGWAIIIETNAALKLINKYFPK